MIQAFQPGQVVEARGRLWRVERSDDQVLYVVPLEQVEASPVALFLPLEGPGIRPMAVGRPPVEPGDPVLHDLFLRAHRFTMMHGAAPLVSLQRSRVIPTNYQLVPVMMALEMPRVRLMIADDVGLGKTIEAGLIAVELLARKRAQRVLVVTPANLRVQWQQAFKYFFHLAFTVLSSMTQRKLGQSLPPGANPWAYFPFVITSLDYAKTDAVRNLVLGQRWDLVIVDEAHSAAMPVAGMGRGSSDKESFEFVRDLTRKATHAVLATATPHNGYSVSFASLLRMLDEVEDKPGQIRSALGIVDGTENEPRVNRANAVRHVVQRRRQDVLEWFEREGKPAPFPTREGTSEQFIEPNKTELAVYEALQNYQRFVFQPRDGRDAPVVTKWMVMHFLRLATSSPRALRASMEARIRTLKGRMTQDDDPVLSAATQRSLRDTVLDHHFGSKEGVWQAVVNQAVLRYAHSLEAQLEQNNHEPSDPAEALRSLMRSQLLVCAAQPEVAKLLMLEGVQGGPRLNYILEQLIKSQARLIPLLLAVQKNGQLRQFDPPMFLLFLLLMGDGPLALPALVQVMTGHDVHSTVFLERHIETLTETLLPKKQSVRR